MIEQSWAAMHFQVTRCQQINVFAFKCLHWHKAAISTSIRRRIRRGLFGFHTLETSIRQKDTLLTEEQFYLFIVAYLNLHLTCSKTNNPKQNPVSLQSRRCRKTQMYIRAHIPTLVYCEVFTNLCLGKDICIWRATRTHSFLRHISSVTMLSIIKNNHTRISDTDREGKKTPTHKKQKTGHDVPHFFLDRMETLWFMIYLWCWSSGVLSDYVFSHKLFWKISTRNSWFSDTKTMS